MRKPLIGERIRQARDERGMTLRQVADKAGLHLSTISRIERGEIDPSLESQLIPIATALGLRLPALLRNVNLRQEK